MPTWESEFSTPGSSARIWLVLQVDLVAQEIANNRSLVNWSARMEERVNASPYNLNGVMSGNAAVDGGVWSAGGLKYDFRNTNVTIPLASGSKWIAHNADGTKTVAVSAFYGTDSILGSAALASQFDLPAIPRNRIRVGQGAVWRHAELYVGINGQWRRAQAYAGVGGAWRSHDPS